MPRTLNLCSQVLASALWRTSCVYGTDLLKLLQSDPRLLNPATAPRCEQIAGLELVVTQLAALRRQECQRPAPTLNSMLTSRWAFISRLPGCCCAAHVFASPCQHPTLFRPRAPPCAAATLKHSCGRLTRLAWARVWQQLCSTALEQCRLGLKCIRCRQARPLPA